MPIVVERLSHCFVDDEDREVRAIDRLDLELRDGEFLAVVGPSGCGKSTLLRLIAGLIRPSSGGIRIDGTLLTEPHPKIGMVFQNPTLLPWADVLGNVLFPLSLMGKVDAAARARARELLALVGLEGFENHRPDQLSGGMQQRVAICRGLIHDPAILLMDEPFGALDALTREEISLQLLRLWEERPKTIVFITHSIPEAVLLADRILVMSPRPGRALDTIEVNLPRPRSFDMESDDEFQSCTRRIRRHIFGSPGRATRPAKMAEAVL